MAEEIKKVISIDTKGAQSVKDLIAQVEKLRGLLKTLDKTSDEYKDTLSELKNAQDTLSSSIKTNKQEVEAAEGSYNQLSQQMRELKKEWKATSDEAERNALGKEIKGINDQLKALDQSIGNNQRNVGNYAGSFQSLKEEIRQARDVMAGAARGSDEYAAAARRAAEASDKLRDMQKEIVNGASGLDNQFSVISNTMSSVAGGFAAAQGAMALFGAESENLQKTFVKLQAAMSMTQGFKALAELPKALNAAKIAFGGVTTSVKTFTKSLTGIKGAIAATGIGLLLVLLGELIANWDKVTEAVENFVGGLDGLKEKLAGIGNVIKNLVTGPFKALGQALKLDFKGAAETLKNSFSVAANYAEGASKQATKNAIKAEERRRREFAKSREEYIADMEAQKGADWKYSKEGQKAYRELYNAKLKMYKKDSEEYKKAQREMWSYERELKDRKKTNTPKPAKPDTDNAAEQEAKEIEERRKAAVEAYEKLIATETSEEEKLHQETLAKLKDGLELQSLTQEEYNKGLEAEEERHKKVLKEIAEKQANELADIAIQSLKNLQAENLKQLELISADIAASIFPSNKEMELAAKQFNEGGGIARYITGPASQKQIEEGVLTIHTFLMGLTSDLDALREYMASGKRNGSEQFFLNIVNYSEMASEAAIKMNNKRRELNDALLQGDKELAEKLKAELEKFSQEFNLIINEMKISAFDSVNQLDELVKTSIGTKEGWLSTFFQWRVVKGEDLVKQEITNNNLELAAFIATSQERIKQINEELLTQNLAEEEKIKLLQEIEELKRREIEKTAEIEQKNANVTLDTIRRVEDGKKKLIQSTLDTIANTGDILMNWSDNIVKNETKNGKTMSDEKRKQAEGMFKVGKALAISEAVVSTYQGAQESYTSLASIPYVGPALGIAAAAAAVTAGILRIQQIASQEFGDSGNVSDTSTTNAVSAVAVPQLESNPYSYVSTVTNAADEDEMNRPIVLVSDVEDALKVRENRVVETSF